MDKIRRLQEQRKRLEREQEILKNQIEKVEENINNSEKELANCYQEFFNKKQQKEFVLYERFPSRDVLECYYQEFGHRHPLSKYGELSVKEMAEIIKQLYSFEKQKNYHILTMGLTEEKESFLRPYLYFLILSDKYYEELKEENNTFRNEKKFHYFLDYIKKEDCISLQLERTFNPEDNRIEIECLTNHHSDEPGAINYFDYKHDFNWRRYPELRYTSACYFKKTKQIFKFDIGWSAFDKTSIYRYKGIKDVLDFNIHLKDSFIAKVLISICIYKRNNGIVELTSDDYNHIFEILYGERVDIIGLAEKDITRSLTYVPNSKYGI